MSQQPEGRPEKAHADDMSPCASATVVNDAGTLRCAEHGRAVWGAGWLISPDAVSVPGQTDTGAGESQ